MMMQGIISLRRCETKDETDESMVLEISTYDCGVEDDESEEEYTNSWMLRQEKKRPEFVNVILPTDIFTGNSSLMATTSNATPLQLQRIASGLLNTANADVNSFTTSLSSAKRKMKAGNREMAQISKDLILKRVDESKYKCTLHFDGKLVKEVFKDKCFKHDKLAVIIETEKEGYLLGVPTLNHHQEKTNLILLKS